MSFGPRLTRFIQSLLHYFALCCSDTERSNLISVSGSDMTWRKGRNKKNSKKTQNALICCLQVKCILGLHKKGNVWISVLTVSESVYIVFCW